MLTVPTLAPIENVTVFAGAPLNIALDGFDADGDALVFSASSDNPNLGLAIPTGNRSMRISVTHTSSGQPGDSTFSGDMVFQLFDDLAPNTAGRIAELAQQGFYDQQIFHRVAENADGSPFVIQGGDPLGSGIGGSGVKFDDEFHALLQHTSANILSMANSGRDTNDSQFFVTAFATRFLDFRHTVFGFLTEGGNIRELIQSVPVGANDKPLSDVVMQTVSVFVDQENGVLRLSAPEGTTGTATVTVTADDGQGGIATRTFQVTILPDATNSRPFLNPTPATLDLLRYGSISFNVSATDVEGGEIVFGIQTEAPIGLEVSVDPAFLDPVGQVATTAYTIDNTTAPIGVYTIRLAVNATDQPSDLTTTDTQLLTIRVVGVELVSDNGAVESDRVTNLNNTPGKLLQFRVGLVDEGTQIVLKVGDTVIGTGAAGADGIATITTNGTETLADGVNTVTAFRDDGGTLTPLFEPLEITVDTAAPLFTSLPVLTAISGLTYNYNVQTNEEGNPGLVYTLTEAPSGMTINVSTGVIDWIPTVGQPNAHAVVVQVKDQFGDIAEQMFEVFVDVPPTVDAVSDQILDEGVPFSLVFTASDANVPPGTFTFSLSNAPAGAAIDPTTGEFTWTPDESQGPGAYDITILAEDDTGLAGSRTVKFTVREVNTPPILSAISDRVIDEHAAVLFNVNASDADLPKQALAFRLGEGAPAGATIDPSTGFFSFTASEEQGGQTFAVEVIVEDGLGGSDSTSFQIEVIETNTPPVVAAIPIQSIAPGGLLSFAIIASDPDIPAQTITYSLGDDAPEGAAIDPETGVVTWQTAADVASGAHTFTVAVTDSEGATTTQTVTVEVGDDAPLALFPGGPFAAQLTDTLSLLSGEVLPTTIPREALAAPGAFGGQGLFLDPPEFVAGAPNYRFGPDTGVQSLAPPLERYEVQRPTGEKEDGEQPKEEEPPKDVPQAPADDTSGKTGGDDDTNQARKDSDPTGTEESADGETDAHGAAVAALDLAREDVVFEVLLAARDESPARFMRFAVRPLAQREADLRASMSEFRAAWAAERIRVAAESSGDNDAPRGDAVKQAVREALAAQKSATVQQAQAAAAMMFPLLVTDLKRQDGRSRGPRDIGPWRWRRS